MRRPMPEEVSEEVSTHLLSEGECARLIPVPADDANKYSRGVLAVIGGSAEYPGAPIMSALAAARAGAGYVRLFVPEGAAPAARAHLLSIPVNPCAQTPCGSFDVTCVDAILQASAKADAFALGPGMGTGEAVIEFFAAFLRALDEQGDRRPILFDADGLNILAHHPEFMQMRAGCDDVLTPHEGEAARLLGRRVRDRLRDAREIANKYRGTVVLKGPRTIVVGQSGPAALRLEGDPELAKAGTGDVLTGIIGSFLAQGLSAYDASRLGVFVHGRAGRIAALDMSVMSVMPEDIIERIGSAFISMGV